MGGFCLLEIVATSGGWKIKLVNLGILRIEGQNNDGWCIQK